MLFHYPITTVTFYLEGLVDLCYCCSHMKIYSALQEANWPWLILLHHAFPPAHTTTSVMYSAFLSPLPEFCLALNTVLQPEGMPHSLVNAWFLVLHQKIWLLHLTAWAHCTVSKQSALAPQPLSISLQVKLIHCLLLTWPPILWIQLCVFSLLCRFLS